MNSPLLAPGAITSGVWIRITFDLCELNFWCQDWPIGSSTEEYGKFWCKVMWKRRCVCDGGGVKGKEGGRSYLGRGAPPVGSAELGAGGLMTR